MWRLRKGMRCAATALAAVSGVALLVAPAHAETYRIDNTDQAKRIHMRQTASNRSKVVAYIPPDATLTGTGRCDAKWCEVSFKGRTGWVFRRYLVPARTQQAEPSEKAESVAALPGPAQNDALPELQDTMIELVFTAGRPIPVYAFPSDRLPAAGRITPDVKTVEDLGTCTRKFCYIRSGSLVGWISDEAIAKGDEKTPPEQEAAAKEESPSGPPPRALDNTVPTATQAAGQIGALADGGPAMETKFYTLAGLSGDASLPVRESPDDAATILGWIPGNASSVEGLRKCLQKWCLVRFEQLTGWVARRHLADEKAAGERRYQVSGVALWGALDVMEFPGSGAAIIGHVPSYATGLVPIGACDKDWCHVRYLGIAGWVNAKYLAPQAR